MSNNSAFTDIFKFVALRSVQKTSAADKIRLFFAREESLPSDDISNQPSVEPEFIRTLLQYANEDTISWAELKGYAREYANSVKYQLDEVTLNLLFDRLQDLFMKHTKGFNRQVLISEITNILRLQGSGKPSAPQPSISWFTKLILILRWIFTRNKTLPDGRAVLEVLINSYASKVVAPEDKSAIINFLSSIKKSGLENDSLLDTLWCLLYALTIESDMLQPVREKTIKFLRILNLLKNIDNIKSSKDLIDYLNATPLVPPYLFKAAPKLDLSPDTYSETAFSNTMKFSDRDKRYSAYLRPIGIGDHKVVRQKIKKYELGEIAHVENVMGREFKERKHRRLDRTEESLIYEKESSTESEKDLQNSNRFELQKEVSTTVSQDLSLQAGVNVSASYGPTVQLQAQTNFAMDTSKTQSEKTAAKYAQEIVSRSVMRINESIKEKRTKTTIAEIEEINTHGFDNKASSNPVIGVYRWLNKVYKAQVVNYGKRFMFEFIVPEPAAFYIYSQEHGSSIELGIKEPKAPESLAIPGNPLEPSDIDENNFYTWVEQYEIPDIKLPPVEFVERTVVIPYPSKENKDDIKLAEDRGVNISQKIEIPEGYCPIEFTAAGPGAPKGNYDPAKDSYWIVWVGHTGLSDWDCKTGINSKALDETVKYKGEDLPVILYGYGCWFVYLNVTVKFRRTPKLYDEWKYNTYISIINAYNKQKADYDAKVAEANAAQGVVIKGNNPDTNRIIEKNELKKSCISLIRDKAINSDFISTGSGVSDTYPEVNTLRLKRGAGEIQFFEQAFEWDEMTYLYYPYFWGRRPNWIKTLKYNDNDPLFNQFLQAGAARIVLPVRPSYELPVLHYLNTGELWGGGEAPVLDSELYVSIAAEMKEQAGIVTPDMLTGEEWEVRIPTTLVYLQTDAELPVYEA